MHFIGFQRTGATIGIKPLADLLVQTKGMIGLNALIAADARHRALTAAAEAGHQMIDNAAGKNDPVSFGNPFINVRSRTAASRADID